MIVILEGLELWEVTSSAEVNDRRCTSTTTLCLDGV